MNKTNVYFQLDYDTYKHIENQMRDFDSIERTHTGGEKDTLFYHNSVRLDCGDFVIEFQGPIVKAPLSAIPANEMYYDSDRAADNGYMSPDISYTSPSAVTFIPEDEHHALQEVKELYAEGERTPMGTFEPHPKNCAKCAAARNERMWEG